MQEGMQKSGKEVPDHIVWHFEPECGSAQIARYPPREAFVLDASWEALSAFKVAEFQRMSSRGLKVWTQADRGAGGKMQEATGGAEDIPKQLLQSEVLLPPLAYNSIFIQCCLSHESSAACADAVIWIKKAERRSVSHESSG